MAEETPKNEESPASNEEIPATLETNDVPVLVTIAENKLHAHLTINPSPEITDEIIRDALTEAGVIYGISENKIAVALEKCMSEEYPFEVKDIARGVTPHPAKEGNLEISIDHITSSDELGIAKEAEFFWELQKNNIHIKRVDAGDEIAHKILSMPSVPGKNVLDEDLFNDEIIRVEILTGENVSVSEDQLIYSSKISGFVYFIENKIGVLPINFDGTASLELSDDNMEANLIIHPAGEKGKPVREDYIKKLFPENHIVFGIDEEKLATTLNSIAKGLSPQEPILIASGKESAPGNDGSIEYLFNTETSLKPDEDEKGNVDYKNISIIQAVATGKPLAKIIPATAGSHGKDILGQELPAKDGVEATLPMGENTEVAPDDPNILIASVDGNVRLNKRLVEIHEGFVVSGDVNFSTGNIDYEKSVTIKGDVKSSFNVKCGGDLEVDGSIEDSEVIVDGNVLCKYGFIGHGDGVIKCNGNVNIGFLKNQKIYCRKSIIIAKEAINPEIYSRKSVIIDGRSLSVAGGHIVAHDSIKLQVVGNESGVKTIVEVGLDYTLTEEKDKAEESLKTIKVNRKKLKDTSQKFERMLAIKKKLPPKDEVLFNKLTSSIHKYDTQIKALEDRIDLIKKKMGENENSFIKVENCAMPGTIFKIGDRQHIVKDKLVGPKTIKMINFEIKIL